MSAENREVMPLFDNSKAYLRSEVMAVTGATRGEIQGLLDSGVCLPNRPRGRTLHRWPRDEIVLASIALKLARSGMLLASIRLAIDAARHELQAGSLAAMMVDFDSTGRFKAATRLKRGALLGDLTKALKVPAAFGFRLLINVAAEASNIDVKLRQHRADHGAVRRGPKSYRKSA